MSCECDTSGPASQTHSLIQGGETSIIIDSVLGCVWNDQAASCIRGCERHTATQESFETTYCVIESQQLFFVFFFFLVWMVENMPAVQAD